MTEIMNNPLNELSARNFHPGAITKISMHNFLSFTDAEFEVGPKLNIILGPNGSGKSSIICAIALCLGGSPKLLGRSTVLNDFINHDKSEAWVEVDLEIDDPGSRCKIRREFSRAKKVSKWSIDGFESNERDVKEHVSGMGIIVENLCTFLPQDRVGDFSGYNPQQVLTETCKAIDEVELYAQYQELIQKTSDTSDRVKECNKAKEDLEKLMAQNELLNIEVERMNRRLSLIKKVKLLKQKKIWIEYDILRENTKEKKARMIEAKEEYNRAVEEHQPLQNALIKVKAENDELNKTWARNKESFAILQQKKETLQNTLVSTKSNAVSLLVRKNTLKNRKMKLEDKKKELSDTIVKMKADLEASLRNAEVAKTKHSTLSQSIRRVDDEQLKAENIRRQYNTELYNLSESLRESRTRLESIASNKSRFKKSQKSVPYLNLREWINSNREKFDSHVYGPIALEISASNDDAIRCLECAVNYNIMTAFVTTNLHDREVLSNQVRKEKLSLSVLNCEGGMLRDCTSTQPFRTESLSHLSETVGEVLYLDSTFEAPDAVRQVLRDHSGVHGIMVGGPRLEASLEEDPNMLKRLAKGETGRLHGCMLFTILPSQPINRIQVYIARVSNYSGEITRYHDTYNLACNHIFMKSYLSDSVKEIKQPPQILGGGVDEETKQRAQEEFDSMRSTHNAAKMRMEEINETISNLNNQITEMERERSHCLDIVRHSKNMQQKVTIHENKLKAMSEKLESWEDTEVRKISEKYAAVMKDYIDSIKGYQATMSEISNCIPSRALIHFAIDEASNRVEAASARVQESRENNYELKTRHDSLSGEFQRAKVVLREANQKCTALAPLKDADGNFLPLHTELQSLPADIEEIDQIVAECEAEIDACVDNPEVISLYEKGKKRIEEIKEYIESIERSMNEGENEVADMLDQWTARLAQTVEKISTRFSHYMEEMNCGGEVRLHKEKALERWGIEIRVRFRNENDERGLLKVLNAAVHSGGERSVSTILYLMAIQDIHRSPFRVVDEINQGMDPHNERLIFSRIVRNSCGPLHPQFFLVTPKLLQVSPLYLICQKTIAPTLPVIKQGLVAMDNPFVTFIFVCNGPHVSPGGEQISIRDFIERSRTKRQKMSSNHRTPTVVEVDISAQ